LSYYFVLAKALHYVFQQLHMLRVLNCDLKMYQQPTRNFQVFCHHLFNPPVMMACAPYSLMLRNRFGLLWIILCFLMHRYC